MLKIRIEQEHVKAEIKSQRIRLQVFAIEVQSKGKTLADKILLKQVEDSDD